MRAPDVVATDPVVEAYKAGIDRTLLRENLRLTPEQRVRKMAGALKLLEEMRTQRDKLIRRS